MESRNCPGTILPARPLGRRPQRPCPWSNGFRNSTRPLLTSPTENWENWGQSRFPKRDCFDENCGLEIDSDPTSLALPCGMRGGFLAGSDGSDPAGAYRPPGSIGTQSPRTREALRITKLVESPEMSGLLVQVRGS